MAMHALVFWFGVKKVDDGTINVSDMMRIPMAIMMALQAVSGATSFIENAPKAFKARSTIAAIRDPIAPIDCFSSEGLRPTKVDGRLEFGDIAFRHPTRLEINVLKHYNLTIEAGQTVAFCGPSSGGKSTIISNRALLRPRGQRQNIAYGLPSQAEIEDLAFTISLDCISGPYFEAM
ncbi:ABC transporter B member 10 [Phytophthora boehmeriae]|uniref:ABC transporter B member 10 n=1 Tax=Phytophthora boehmeriae TaxID=109152 RepID=A0A8T1WQ48_9STRA|nr:ABC transporter B member 10 [Phytophthora boehmeriae]